MNKWYNRVFIAFGVIFASLMFYSAGLDAHKGFWNDSVFSCVSAVFWIVVTAMMIRIEWDRREDVIRKNNLNNMDKVFKEIAEATEAHQLEHYLHDMAEAVVRDVTKGKKPQKAHCAKIEKAFHENVEDHWLSVTLADHGGFNIEISNHPFPSKETGAKPRKVSKTPIATKAASRKPAAKPLSKSQERRIAATKKVGK